MDANLIDPMVGGYRAVASLYEASRPSYPSQAVVRLVEALGIREGAVVADVGAGTGKFTRLLVPTGASIIAVEPVAAMRVELRKAVPGAELVAGVAGSLPFAEASLDAITVAQAFQWFATAATVAEFHRVLRPGGGLGLIWNRRDRNTAVWQEIEKVIAPHRPARDMDWRPALRHHGLRPISSEVYGWEYEATPASISSRIASMSWMARLPHDLRTKTLADVERIARRFSSGGRVPMSEATEIYWTHRT